LRIIVAGIIGRYPWGGVTWCSLMYLLGLRDLGHDVYYLEDTRECNYDPETNEMSKDPRYALRYISESLSPFGFGDRWCYVDFLHNHHGMTHDRMKENCTSADLLIVLSGGVWIWRDEYLKIPRKIFIDSDPAFTQFSISNAVEHSADDAGSASYVKFFETYDTLFTFGQNIGTPRSTVPTAGMTLLPTTQPITTELWQPASMPARPLWTTVMTWQIESFADVGGNKDQESLKVINLSNRCRAASGPELELAVNGPRDMLTEKGWRCVNPFPISSDLWRYHGYITSSRGEVASRAIAEPAAVAGNVGVLGDAELAAAGCNVAVVAPQIA
jgi:hypothetical protein